ncbi:MAG: S-layer homology domain-containing protein [Armatimonadetes bacterium]|nr:S-layer homology domain-containing protein [Armatimonadota bacterium]
MNKTFKYAVSVVLAAGMVTPAFAQRDNFPDVADTHWAYEAVARLKKEGIITGYPDGTFGGKRMMTRYEMASLLYALYMNLKNVTDGLDAQIKTLSDKVDSIKPGGDDNGPAIQALRDQLNALSKDVSGMKGWGDDIAQLKKMSSTYEKELSQMGVDVEAMKKDLSDLSKRVSDLENKKNNVTISGDASFFMGASIKGNTGSAALNSDGRYFGGTGTGAGIDTLTVLHELGLKFSTNNATGANVVADLVVGNATQGFGNQSSTTTANGMPYNAAGTGTSVYADRLYATFNDGLGGLNFDAKIGRQGLKLGGYVLERPDTTSFWSNERWDNGEYAMDGANLKFGLGQNTDLNLFLGQVANIVDASGNPIQPIMIGEEAAATFGTATLSAARAMGGSLGFKIGENGKLDLSFVDLDSNTSANTPVANRLETYGADFSYKISDSLGLTAGTGKSQFKNGTSTVSYGSKNTRTNVGLNFKTGGLGIDASYAEIGNGYVAAGAWSKAAIYHNLNDLKQTSVKANYAVNDKFSIHGGYMKGDQISVSNKDAVKSTTVGADFKINDNWTLMADYEDTKFKGGYVIDGTTPQFKFTTLGFGYDMGANTMFKLFYQASDITGITPASSFYGLTSAGAMKGSTFGAQFSVKF